MTIHYHGTPISPMDVLYELKGRCFCVSHAAPQDVRRCHDIGQSVMLDNGAFSAWKRGHEPNWSEFYKFCDHWLDWPTTWAVIPDVIDGGSQLQDAMIREWPHGKRQAAPVWHMDEPLDRLLRLCDEGWLRVCIGSTAEYAVVLSPEWQVKMDKCWNKMKTTFGRAPPIHMLRGMQCSGMRWPFYSVDSTDVAQNHHRPENTALAMASRWDAKQCPGGWVIRDTEQMELSCA